jgi:acyl-CoA dehydrogenase
VVEKGTPGFTVGRIEKKMGLTASETATVFFEGCRVPVENLLVGKSKNAGFKAAMHTFDLTRPMVAAMGVGIGRCAWERAAEIARAAFGANPRSPLELRLLDRLAMARRRLDAARLLCWRAAWKMDHRLSNTIEASMAKVHAPPAAMMACTAAMDICGLAGVRNDELVEKCFRDVKVFDIFEGTGEVQRIVLARRLFGYPSARK